MVENPQRCNEEYLLNSNFVAIECHFRDSLNTPFLPWGDSDCEEKHP